MEEKQKTPKEMLIEEIVLAVTNGLKEAVTDSIMERIIRLCQSAKVIQLESELEEIKKDYDSTKDRVEELETQLDDARTRFDDIASEAESGARDCDY